MNRTFKKVLSMVMASLMLVTSLVQSPIGLLSFATNEKIEDKVLFQSSFEDGDNKLLSSTLDDGHLSNVIKVDSPTGGGKGLEVLYETVDGSEDYLGSECKYNLFDGKTGTKFLSSGSKVFVIFALKSSAVISSYSIASANDEPSRDPKNWTLYGSDDGNTWVSLDQREGISFSARQQTKCFGFSNQKSFKWYKLDVTSNSGASLTQFSNLDLFTEQYDDGGEGKVDTNTTIGKVVSYDGTADYTGNEVKANLFDGSTATKWIATGGKNIWISVKLSSPLAVNAYQISVCNDHHTRDPLSWNFYGSLDGERWELLDSRTNEDFVEFFQTNTYKFNNTIEYSYYKIDEMCHNSTDGVGLNITHMSEFKLMNTISDEDDDEEETTEKITVDQSTVSGSAVSNPSEGLDALFDGSLSTKLCTTYSGSVWVSVKLNAPAAINTYIIGSGADAEERDPKNWKFYGSIDGKDWTLLDEKVNEDLSDRSTLYPFYFNNNTQYSYYKIEITANNGTDSWGYDLIQFSELQFAITDGVESSKPVKQEFDTSTVKGSATLDGSQGILQIFDGSTSTKVCIANVSTLWVSAKLTHPAAVNTYKIASANDHDPRDPKDWTLYGSLDGEKWVTLDIRSNEDMPERNTYYTYTFNNTTAYSYYKLDITSNNGADAVGLQVVQFSEWQLFVDENAVVDETKDPVKEEVDISTIKGSEDMGGSESKKNVFDGKTSTKVCAPGSSFTISFALKNAAVIKGYGLTSANDHISRSPKKWIFYGSENGENWVELDRRTGIEFSDYFEEQIFAFSNDKEYLYYKLEVLENAGNSYTQFSELSLFSYLDEALIPEEIPGMVTDSAFGPISTECNTPGAWTGNKCLAVYGQQTALVNTYARNVIYKDLSIPVTENTRLSYVIFPGLFNIHSYDYEYTSCRVIIDLKFTDGTYLSELGAKDQYGSLMTPAGQADGECLYTAQWNYVESCIGEVAAGKTIEKICVYFDMDNAEDASKFITFFDDLKIEDKKEVVYENLSDYINILRGTNNDIAFSRGMCTPGVTLPGGFNFYTPVNNADSATLPYTYQQTRAGNPLDSISVIHAPNFWIGSYGSFQFMANTSVDTSGGTSKVIASDISSSNREASFSHANEIAKAHLYSVVLNDGSAASGVKIEVTPTQHGSYVRFTFPENAENVNVIFDNLWSSGSLNFANDGKTFTAKTTHGSPYMYVYGEFDTSWSSASVLNSKQGIVSFAEGTTVVTMKLATSFISKEQAQHNLELEFADDDTFDTILAKAQKEWNELCGKFEIEGGSYTELVSFYSSLYRLYAFPNLFSENEGSNEAPVWVHASPYKNGQKTPGIMYTNNGFWDTYRTAWSAYALFTANRDTDYLNGMIQHYIDSGWMPRWLGPGAVNCMVGTSSDIIFADAYIKGIDFNYKAAWESMLKSASSYSSNMTSGGRKENNTAPFVGYIANDNPVTGTFVQEAYSSSIEGYINDYGLYRMADAMGLEAEAEYYLNRCMNYVLLFHKEADFFMGKSSSGVWSSRADGFNPAQWNGDKYDFTESVGWVNAFPAVFDGQGMVNLYGGPEALTAKLDKLFDDSIAAMKNVVELSSVHHEISEFKEVKMGQYMHNNQPAHHVIYTYAFSSTPYKVQEYTREVLRHVYVGSEIGQGYPGDEDNGEMSAWYVFNALGFYPYSVASGEYVIGSPLFDKVTIHLDNGNDIVIVTNNNSDENIYIQSAKVNNKEYNNMFLTHEMLTSGCVIEFQMGSTPSNWGLGNTPSSLTKGETTTAGKADISKTSNITSTVDGSKNLFDNNSLTATTISDNDTIVLETKGAKISIVTLTSGNKLLAPTAFSIEISNDGSNWFTVYENNEISFLFNNFITPYLIPEEYQGYYRFYKITLKGGTSLAEVEFIGEEFESGSLDEIPDVIDPSQKNGFYEENGNLYFYKNGKKAKYWFEHDGKTYYASGSTNVVINYNKKIQGKFYVWNDETGLEIADGFVTDENGTKCYDDGINVIGWRHEDGSGPKIVNGISEQYSQNPEGLYYFLSTTGYMITSETYKLGGYNREFNADHTVKPLNGLQTQGGELYYYVNGVKQTGWYEINGYTYYFRSSDDVYGRAATKWTYIGDKIYYFYATTSKTPFALKTEGTIGGILYEYSNDGYIIYNGFVNCEFANYANNNTAANIQKMNGTTRYYINGVMQTKWHKINGNWYYFYALGSAMGSGYMCVQSRTIGGVAYEFTQDGICLNKQG